MQTTRIFALLVVLQLAFLSGCTSTVPAAVTMRPGYPLKPTARIYLSARMQWDRIAQSLEDAGLTPTDEFGNADYALDVRVGRNRSNAACGGLSNVAYTLTRDRRPVMVIKGRGRMGICAPNVFDDMSRKLASFASARSDRKP
jgi:hypothetical protein